MTDGGGNDVFVHVSVIQDSGIQSLHEGQKMSFDTEPDKRGKGHKAINIELR
jgi:CspA family cold shock protein